MAPPPADLGPVAVGDGIVADSNFIEDDWDDEEEEGEQGRGRGDAGLYETRIRKLGSLNRARFVRAAAANGSTSLWPQQL